MGYCEGHLDEKRWMVIQIVYLYYLCIHIIERAQKIFQSVCLYHSQFKPGDIKLIKLIKRLN